MNILIRTAETQEKDFKTTCMDIMKILKKEVNKSLKETQKNTVKGRE